MPMRPLLQGCSAIQAWVSYPSSGSATKGDQGPSESQRPRTSWITQA